MDLGGYVAMESKRLGQPRQLSGGGGLVLHYTQAVTHAADRAEICNSACSLSLATTSSRVCCSSSTPMDPCMHAGASEQEEVAMETNLGQVEPSAPGLHALILPCN
jgi:hypothetical protein